MKIREDLVLRHIGEEYMIVDPGQDMVDMTKVFTLNHTAAWLWEQIAGKEFTVETLVELLKVEYDLSQEQAQKDINSFLEVFKKNGLLNNELNGK